MQNALPWTRSTNPGLPMVVRAVMFTIIVASLLVLVMMSNTASANSGSHAAGDGTSFSAEELAAFAKQVEKAAASKGARVFIISRLGRPRSELPEGINYTHTAFGVYSSITLTDGTQVPG